MDRQTGLLGLPLAAAEGRLRGAACRITIEGRAMKHDLVFDLGMHKGEDTAFYLKKGFRIVGVEANPELAEFCRKRFAAEVVSGSVKIIEGAVVNKDTISKGTVTFYKNVGESEWGTIWLH
jgi:16S rRNA A1518/A1519 N6-dimethyltransferase RsmA/KsgA/DIM1 with predicted DNA glycosylase/AP lyase activity